jgi:cobalt-zinc-cadmium efflux system membrane fusion protein
VTAGEVLAVVHSRDIAAARSKYNKAIAESRRAKLTLAREQDLHEEEISARKDLEQAQAAAAVADAAVIESRQYLQNLGLSEKEIENSVRQRKDTSSLPVRAPFSGTVIERNAVIGTAVAPGDDLFTVADMSTMWMQVSVAEAQLSSVRVGSLVQARFDVYLGISFEGKIAWVAPTVNPETRMLQARVVLANPQGLLKEGLFGRASLSGFAERNALSVTAGAVQEIDGKAVVFRKLEDDLYETRLVTTSVAHDGNVLVMAGLAPDDEIVTGGSYIVKSEFLKARLGAGCTDD